MRYSSFFHLPNTTKWLFPIGFAIKTLGSLAFIYVYSYHYGDGVLSSDANSFFVESKMLNDVFYESPATYFKFLVGLNNSEEVLTYLPETTKWDHGPINQFNDLRNVLRFHSIIHFISFNQILIHSMISCLLTLIGFRWMLKAIERFTTISNYIQFFSLLLLPNVMFWTSGVLKEPIILFNLGLFLYVITVQVSVLKKFVLLVISLVLMLPIKPYVLICAITAGGIGYLFSKIKRLKWAVVSLLCLLTLGFLSLLTKPMQPVVNVISDKQFDFVNIGNGGVFARADTCVFVLYPPSFPYVIVNKEDSTVYVTRKTNGAYCMPMEKMGKTPCVIYPNVKPWKLYYEGLESASMLELEPIKKSGKQLLKNVPGALGNIFLRPLPSDPPNSMLKWFSFFDSWILVIYFLGILIFFRRKLDRSAVNLLVGLAVFCLILSLIVGLTTPVVGALVRYKVPIQVAVMLIALIVFNPQKIKRV